MDEVEEFVDKLCEIDDLIGDLRSLAANIVYKEDEMNEKFIMMVNTRLTRIKNQKEEIIDLVSDLY